MKCLSNHSIESVKLSYNKATANLHDGGRFVMMYKREIIGYLSSR